MKKAWSLLLLGWVISCGAQAEGASGAGNGGDSAERLLAAARSSVLSTMRAMLTRPPAGTWCRCPQNANGNAVDKLFCRHLEALTDPQATYCDNFFRAVTNQVARLAGDENQCSFLLSAIPLSVGSGSAQRPVLAKTVLAPSGPVWFDYKRLAELSPATAVALVSHELGHKSLYSAHGKYVADDEPIGPFQHLDGGRRLLDAFGSAVAMQAQRLGLVGRTSLLRDKFRCWIEPLEPVGFPFYVQGTSVRVERGRDGYETGVGLKPSDLSCALRDIDGAREIAAVVRIDEPRGCAANAPGRATKMELWEIRRQKNDYGILETETRSLGEQTRGGWNPICQVSEPLVVEATVDAKKYRFTIVYDGSEAAKRTGFSN